MPRSDSYSSKGREASPHLAGRRFPLNFARLTETSFEADNMNLLFARFDLNGFLWLDVETTKAPESQFISFAVGGPYSQVVRLDPISWITWRPQ